MEYDEAEAPIKSLDSFLGIRDKETLKEQIKKFAATDFWHDFHHTDKNLFNRIGSSYNLASGKSVVQFQRLSHCPC